jgi:hypothetical protein
MQVQSICRSYPSRERAPMSGLTEQIHCSPARLVAWEMVGAIEPRPPYHFGLLCESHRVSEQAMPCPLLLAPGQELTTKVQTPDHVVHEGDMPNYRRVIAPGGRSSLRW